MAAIPESVSDFLRQRRFAVAGVSRDPAQAANAVYRKLRDSGFEVFPVNPKADSVRSIRCYADVREIPDPVDLAIVSVPQPFVLEAVRAYRDRYGV